MNLAVNSYVSLTMESLHIRDASDLQHEILNAVKRFHALDICNQN